MNVHTQAVRRHISLLMHSFRSAYGFQDNTERVKLHTWRPSWTLYYRQRPSKHTHLTTWKGKKKQKSNLTQWQFTELAITFFHTYVRNVQFRPQNSFSNAFKPHLMKKKTSEISVSEIRYINTGSSTVAWGLSSQVYFVFCFRGCLLLLGILFHAKYESAVY